MTTHHPSNSLELPPGKTMLDAVMFVASLVSKSSDIDTQLDRVRSITAQRTADELTKDDDRVLSEVYEYLEEYLVTKESLRAFTRESIRTRIKYYFSGGKSTLSLRKPLALMWAIAIGSTLAAILAPETIVSTAVKPTLAITLFFVTINLGAAWMFWMGLQNFKDKIRQAYLPICLGVALVGLTLLQAPIAVVTGQDSSIWFHYITSGITIPIAGALLYIGMRRFAQIGEIKSRLLSAKLVTAICVIVAAITIILPLPDTGVPDWALSVSLTILALGMTIATVTARITYVVRRTLSAAYQWPMTWFLIMLILTALSCIQYGILQLVATSEQPFSPQAGGLITLVISALITLKAATSFRRIDTAIAATNPQMLDQPSR